MARGAIRLQTAAEFLLAGRQVRLTSGAGTSFWRPPGIQSAILLLRLLSSRAAPIIFGPVPALEFYLEGMAGSYAGYSYTGALGLDFIYTPGRLISSRLPAFGMPAAVKLKILLRSR
jgi:hypothetical protein